ncbi:peroxisomal and mitochondrial division factor 1-like [Telopea speciosissima]|uniref:peroxisomal and mitochondrial division factor 1-like n=1 Tax=Telopea speciosissima TaxID=54955 RepID=UPI001CC4E455|nr:peroxisomal and mitochondrial division factor 1-like [Telopea speciosissima]
MAEEAIGNGIASDVDYQTGEEDLISRRDTDLGKDTKISELNRKIAALEQDNSELIREKGKRDAAIKELKEVIEGLRTDGATMKKEIEQSSEDKKAVQVISARALELETEVSRLQHDLVSSMTESDEAKEELRKLKDALQELTRSNLNKQAKIEDLEKEKASLQERIEREVAEMKKSKSESEKLKKEWDEMEKLKSSLEEALKQSQEKLKETEAKANRLQNELVESEKSVSKLKETEAKANRLQNELEESEKSVRKLKELNSNCTATARELDAADAEKGSNGLKLQWQTAVASTGTVAAAAAILYLNYARRR